MAATGTVAAPMGQIGDVFAQLFGAQTLNAIAGANASALANAGAADPSQTIMDALSSNAPDPNAAKAENVRKLSTLKSEADQSGDPQQSLDVLKTFLKGLSAGSM